MSVLRARRAPAWLAGLAAALLGWMLVSAPAFAAPSFPPLNGQRVVDQAGVLPASVKADLTAKLADLESKTSRQLVVVTLSDLQGDDIADYGYQLGRYWGIGQKGTNNGVLFIVAPSERKTRIEVGYGLEPIITDALSSVILNTRVLPKFKAGDMTGGIVDGAQALIDQLSLDPSVAEQKAAAAEQARVGDNSRGARRGSVLGTIWTLFILAIIFSSIFGRGRRGLGGWWWPLIFLGGGRGGGGGGGWSDGGGSSGGGGGFSGGGGSFGGGGSSGSW